jgi:predicted outer membrane repeat protein
MKKCIHAILAVMLVAALLILNGANGASYPVNAQAAEPLPASQDETQPPGDELEAALAQGPEAVVALLDTLHGAALDRATDDIVAAYEQLALSNPPLPERSPVSLAEEEAVQQAQLARDAENRAAALAIYNDPAWDEPEFPAAPQTESIDPPDAVALTVGSPPCSYASVSAALTAASPGDTLLLEGGVTFYTNLVIQKDITIRGGYNGCGSGSSGPTTLNGNAINRVIYIYNNLNVTLANLMITNGHSSGNGAGIFVGEASTLTGDNLNIFNNVSDARGGGMRLLGASVTLTDTNIYDNSALSGGGVHGETVNGHVPTLNLSYYADIYRNEALTGDGFGGGVFLDQGILYMTDCSDLYHNDAIQGGGAYLVGSILIAYGDCSEILENSATLDGGGIYAVSSTINIGRDAELVGNDAGMSGAGSGGGAYLDDSTLWSDQARITFNSAAYFGGGVYATNTSLLDMDLGDLPCLASKCSQMRYNTATSLYGGGAYASDYSEIDIAQTYVQDNTAFYGGAVYASLSQVILDNDLLTRNNATASVGDAVRLYTGAALNGAHNTLSRNDANGAATGVAFSVIVGANLSMNNSIIWGHASSIDLAGLTITCSDIQGGYSGAGNLNTDPHFISPTTSNFHVAKTSPVVDACASGLPADIDDRSRPVNGLFDMGAYEDPLQVFLPLIKR